MTMTVERVETNATYTQLSQALLLQKTDFLASETESLEQRKAHLRALKSLLVENRHAIYEALNTDFGNRSYHETLLAEYITCLSDIDSTLKNIKKWMRPQRRHVDISMYFGAKNRVIPQPIGVVGIIAPWNFPITTIFTQLTAIFAAGNRALVKLSENSQATAQLLIRVSQDYFTSEKLQFFAETGGVGQTFTTLPFDHIIFTGSSATGRKVMACAAQNLTPVTLELGGKCPAIIDPNYSLETAVARIMFAKQFNAGQICTSVDYVFVHSSQLDDFVHKAKKWTLHHVPNIDDNNYTSIIDDVSFNRIADTVKSAELQGAQVINLNEQSANSETRKYPLTLVCNTSSDMTIRQRETFGPVLMVLTYDTDDEVIEHINCQHRPLAMYPFSNNKQLINKYITRIMSGGVTVNDTLFHVGQHDLPFGGIGESGMGHFHGYEGFLTFSKLRPVMHQSVIASSKMMYPPYDQGITNRLLTYIAKFKEL